MRVSADRRTERHTLRRNWELRAASGLSTLVALVGLAWPARSEPAPEAPPARVACPVEMARIGSYCIDRWEVSLVDATTRQELSPYYPPSPRLTRFVHEYWSTEAARIGDPRARLVPLPALPPVQTQAPSRAKGSKTKARGVEPLAVSRAGVVPQGYLSYYSAKAACERAGKRLCTEDEWVGACRGPARNTFPYGPNYVAGRCNVYRNQHPAFALHQNSSVGHLDPRLNLVVAGTDGPLLGLTGEWAECSATWDDRTVFDMVGNLDEWIDDPNGVFVGGFYARATRSGCEARIANHAPGYYDYSLGTRCCRSVD